MRKRMLLFVFVIVLSISCYAIFAVAAGPHDEGCTDCHSTHYAKGEYIIGVEPFKVNNPSRTRNTRTSQGIDSLCLGCHNDGEGILPVNLHSTHPTGVKPMYAKVPKQLLWDGVLTCSSCHDPHPNNANYKYLIVPTKEGKDMGLFCGQCHPRQSDKQVMSKVSKMKMTFDPVIAPIIKFKQKAPVPVKKTTRPAPATKPAQ
ncbi:Doubled CXXCH motif (Paired_CXXCH_1) [Maridesulfovibrio ferrireducens]|uniref:Doubled CXXCH motif (Paired_CXXCH_1) n=1 Tax=Maridesulfovibrio ferrireducens TaxID=246191 RepID=A0A1G9E8E5_9BACT|nr:cytochrome c3 family protein [Maridesulfovibrio ferrireducens]SDK72394.1 Doubled CXXCH motif (Paired_CXXCH_1) [Maridesulfovibrio ferrireducens]